MTYKSILASLPLNTTMVGNCYELLKTLPSEIAHCIVTSPPYWALRDYGILPVKWPAVSYATLGGTVTIPAQECCLGLEATPEAYVGHMVLVFREARRVLRKDGVCWVNLGDSYSGSMNGKNKDGGFNPKMGDKQKKNLGSHMNGGLKLKISNHLKPKDMVGIPWQVAFALQYDGWYLRDDVIWHKPNPMPGSQRDRCTKAHEYIFQLTKSRKYFFDAEAIKQEATDSTKSRLAQDVSNQKGSERGYGGQKHNGNSKAYGSLIAKVRGHEREHSGFNTYWDGITKNEQMSMGAMKRSVWTVATQAFKEAHFATFPEKLIEDPIKASTSRHGACAECGMPYYPTHKKKLVPTSKAGKVSVVDDRDETADKQDQGSNRALDGHKPAHIYETTFTGWQKRCTCETTEVMPCLVLDPFMGSGTTEIVANGLGRNSLGMDAQPAYSEIKQRRKVARLGPLFTTEEPNLIPGGCLHTPETKKR